MDVGFRDPAERRALRVAQHSRMATGTSLSPRMGRSSSCDRLDDELAATDDLAQCLSDADRLELAVWSSNAIAAVSWSGARDCVIFSRSAWGTRPNALELDYGPRGKPRLAGTFAESDLRFNVSHCGDLAIYAFSCGRRSGRRRGGPRMSDADAIAAGFFSHSREPRPT